MAANVADHLPQILSSNSGVQTGHTSTHGLVVSLTSLATEVFAVCSGVVACGPQQGAVVLRCAMVFGLVALPHCGSMGLWPPWCCMLQAPDAKMIA